MHCPRPLLIRNCLLLAVLASCLTSLTRAEDDGFSPLLTGESLDAFEVVGLDKGSAVVKDGEIRLSGKSQGYVATKEEYRNYVLRFDWLYEKHHAKPSDGNSGLLLHVQGPGKVWPQSIEAQIWYKEYGSFYTLDGGKFNPKKDDPGGRNKALKPLGEWNSQEVVCRDGAITLTVNGFEYASGVAADPDHGKIAWMFEGSPIRYRKLKIKILK